MARVDFGRRSGDYARFRPGFPSSFFDRLAEVVALDGIDALDVGTGPGVVALELAARGARVVGVDVAANQIAEAERLAHERELSARARFVVGRAEATGLPNESFDLVTACQCWAWLDHGAAMREAMRVLRSGGRFVVAHFNYLPAESAVARETEALVLRWNPTWAMANHSGDYPELKGEIAAAGFANVVEFVYDHAQPFTHEAWRGRIRTCNGVGSGVLSDADVEAFDSDLEVLLQTKFPREPLIVPHRVWAVVGRKRC
ncbi:MAG: methyltransferase domain-containing protein [Deltaproteobacteria bacterium]|nr:methyltransferase domain-containing protein [Deltaproteobacteria bacterium]